MTTLQSSINNPTTGLLSEKERLMAIDHHPSSKDSSDVVEREPSPALSEADSCHTFTSTGDGYLLRELYGRTFNSVSDLYVLPADAKEHSRLSLQHHILKLQLKGLYVRPRVVEEILAKRKGRQPTAVDIGTGSGSWPIDLAKKFPHVEVVGIDLAPAITGTTEIPPNVRFECDDVNLGLQHYNDSFDVVHQRCSFSGINDAESFIREVYHILRPGGIYLVIEGDIRTCDENMQPITQFNEGEPGFSYYAKLTKAVEVAAGQKCNVDAYRNIPTILTSMGDKWTESGNLELCTPVGPWQPDLTVRQKAIAELMQQDVLNLTEAFRPILLAGGSFPETIDTLIANVKDEVINMKTKLFVKWQCFWAIKR